MNQPSLMALTLNMVDKALARKPAPKSMHDIEARQHELRVQIAQEQVGPWVAMSTRQQRARRERIDALCDERDALNAQMSKGRAISTEFVYPPIPDRSFDWSATFEGYEPGEVIGRGETEAAAIADLIEQAA